MYEHDSDLYILSSICPYSTSLITFASRIGGILDPNFLKQCQITDKKLQKRIKQLKQIPLKYESLLSTYNYEEDIFLDIDIKNKKQFLNSYEFKQYNTWLNKQYQSNRYSYLNDDLYI